MTAHPRWGGVSRGRLYANPEKYAIGNASCQAGSRVSMENGTGTPLSKWHKTDTACSPDVPVKKENPDALAGAIGADLQSWFDWIDDNTRRESAARALSRAVVDCDPTDRLPFLELLIEALRPGQPLPIFSAIMAEARQWAAWASRAELKAFALASYEAMSEADQVAFLGHLDRRVAA